MPRRQFSPEQLARRAEALAKKQRPQQYWFVGRTNYEQFKLGFNPSMGMDACFAISSTETVLARPTSNVFTEIGATAVLDELSNCYKQRDRKDSAGRAAVMAVNAIEFCKALEECFPLDYARAQNDQTAAAAIEWANVLRYGDALRPGKRAGMTHTLESAPTL